MLFLDKRRYKCSVWALVTLASLMGVLVTATSVEAIDIFGRRSRSRRPLEKVKKECLDCHEKDKFSKKFVHSPVASQKCDACHKRHGLVGALVLKFDEEDKVCFECHQKDKLGLTQSNIHKAMKKGK